MKRFLYQSGSGQQWAGVLTFSLVMITAPSLVTSADMDASMAKTLDVQQVNLVVGKSVVLDVPVAIKRASLADPQVADAMVLSPKQIYVTGKSYGTTNLTLWGQNGQVLSVFDLDVGVDLDRLNRHLKELLPDETNINLKSTHDHVMISGTVSNEGRRNQVLAVAEAYAPKKVLNFLKVYPEPPGSVPLDIQTVTVEVIKGTDVSAIKF